MKYMAAIVCLALAACSECSVKPELADRCAGVPVCAKTPKPDGATVNLECKHQ